MMIQSIYRQTRKGRSVGHTNMNAVDERRHHDRQQDDFLPRQMIPRHDGLLIL